MVSTRGCGVHAGGGTLAVAIDVENVYAAVCAGEEEVWLGGAEEEGVWG